MKEWAFDERRQTMTYPWWDMLHIEACWGWRAEDAGACAIRLVRMLDRLGPLHPAFPQMAWTGGPLRSLYPLPARPEEFASLFKPQRFYDERSKRRLPCGFSLTADARLEDSRFVQLRIDAGRHVRGTPYFHAPNIVSIVTVVKDVAGSDRAFVDALKPIFCAVIEAWQPDFGGVSSKNFAPESAMKARPSVFSSDRAMIFLAADLAARIEPPPAAIVESVDGGLLMMATEKLYRDRSPSVRVAADAIRSAVAPLGL